MQGRPGHAGRRAGRAPLAWDPVPTGAELAPERFLDCALAAAGAALDGVEGRVAGLGVASMAETGVLLDRRGAPVIPAIAWHDIRGGEQAERLIADLGRERYATRTGLSSEPMRTVVKLRWLRDHVEETARGVRWLSVGEWIVHRLGGQQCAELSLASRTGFLDLATRSWWDEPLAWAGAPAGLLPEPAEAGTPLGTVGDALAAARGAVLAVCGHDHLSAAVGAGAVADGDVLDSWGTAEAFVRAAAPLEPDRVLAAVQNGIDVGWHAVPGRQNLLCGNRSGAALGHILDLLGVDAEGRDALEHAALETTPGAGLTVQGMDDDGLELVGIGAGVSPARVWRAALESAARAADEILERMARVAGPHRRVVMTGGWSEGVAARAIREAHVGPLERVEARWAGARGAALIAGRAAGLVGDAG